MSRWSMSTPKSNRRTKDAYVSLDDKSYYRQSVMISIHPPRNDRLKKKIDLSYHDNNHSYRFDRVSNQTTIEGRDLNFNPRVHHSETREDVESCERESNSSRFQHGNRQMSNRNLTVLPSTAGIYSPPRLLRHPTDPPGPIYRSFEANDSNGDKKYPIQTRHQDYQHHNIISRSRLVFQYHEQIGPASLNIHRLRLPYQYINILDKIVAGCEDHVSQFPDGWNTDLYSLTKQDIALKEAPEVYNLARPMVSYMKKVASTLYCVQGLKCDRNQPHVLKYAGDHRGVELHHDKCDITINLMMSRSNSYGGGGTYFPDASTNVRLEFGEFLLHPGSCVHGGSNITSGTRYLMVIFANAK